MYAYKMTMYDGQCLQHHSNCMVGIYFDKVLTDCDHCLNNIIYVH